MFDALIREVASRFGLGDKAGPLLQMLLAFMTNKDSGGLSGFIDLFKRGGLGDVVSSWLGGGAAAKPISNSQLESVLGGGGGLIQAMASRFGFGSDKVSSALTFLLPAVIGRLTPGGTMPTSLPDDVTRFIGPATGWISGLVGSAAGMAHGAATAGAGAVTAAASGASGFKRWLPWIIGAAVLLWLLSMCSRKEEAPKPPPAEKPAASVPAPTPAPTPAPAPKAAAEAPPAAKIYFEVGAAALPAGAADNLKAVVEYLKGNSAAKATISGYHDPTGNKAQNEELAKNRAMAVREALIAAGLSDDRLEMEKPIETTGSSSDAEARRVEVAVRP